jgi:hypothetical protein
MQETLQRLYSLELPHRISDFYVGEAELDELARRGVAPIAAREQLLILEEEGETSLAVFIAEEVLERLHDGGAPVRPSRHNLHDYCLLAEGVSHFVYVSWKAARGEPVTQLEMELQAEVDKYITCYLAHWQEDRGRFPEDLEDALFWRVLFRSGLEQEETDRYQTANRLALQYCRYLERSFLRTGELPRAMPELRRFYRLTHPEKLGHIAARQ